MQRWLLCFWAAFVCVIIPAAVAAQVPSAATVNVDSFFTQAEAAIASARSEAIDLLAPRQFRRAADAVTEAQSLRNRKIETDLVQVKLKIALSEIDDARRTAAAARERLGDVLAARRAALDTGADSTVANWKRTEESFRTLVREFERSPTAVRDKDVQDVTGAYLATRREALRALLLSEARNRIDQTEKRSGARLIPDLLLRAQQAVSRAEADLAQENLDSARTHADAALRAAHHALGMLNVIESVQKDKYPWQTALLPYDDLLLQIGARLNSPLDMAHGGAVAGRQIPALIDAQQESLRTLVEQQEKTLQSFESSLAEAQTSLADAQSRIAELENRLKAAEGARSSAVEKLQKGTETADRIARARDLFKAGEAVILQERDSVVIIRITGVRFAPAATNLDKTHSKIVDKVAEAILLFPGAAIRAEGHTDSEGGDDVNQKISEARAKAVADYLLKKLNLMPEKLPAVGYGESRPIADNSTAEGRNRNRRIDVVLSLSN